MPGTGRRARELLPAKYNDNTGLTAEITSANPNRIDFPLD